MVEYSNLDFDIATLKLSNKIYEPLNVAVFGSSKKSSGNRFISSGYREVGGAVGIIAPPKLEPSHLPYRQLILRSDQIDRGMSGAPVLDLEADKIVGMVAVPGTTILYKEKTGKHLLQFHLKLLSKHAQL